jgi:hypothetical protein
MILPGGTYGVIAVRSETGDQAKDSLLNSYTSSYSKGCYGHISPEETKDCFITKKSPDLLSNNITMAQAQDVENSSIDESTNNDTFTPYQSSSPVSSGQIEGSTYMDNKSGMQLTIPSGWIGFENHFKNNVTNVMIMLDSPPTAKSFEESRPYILMQISPKDPINNEGIVYPHEDIVNLNSSIYYQKAGCKQTSTKDISINTTKAKETVFTCPFLYDPSFTAYTKAIAIDKNNFQIILAYSAYSDTQFATKLTDFDKIIQSIRFTPVDV